MEWYYVVPDGKIPIVETEVLPDSITFLPSLGFRIPHFKQYWSREQSHLQCVCMLSCFSRLFVNKKPAYHVLCNATSFESNNVNSSSMVDSVIHGAWAFITSLPSQLLDQSMQFGAMHHGQDQNLGIPCVSFSPWCPSNKMPALVLEAIPGQDLNLHGQLYVPNTHHRRWVGWLVAQLGKGKWKKASITNNRFSLSLACYSVEMD